MIDKTETDLQERARRLGFLGLVANWQQWGKSPWVPELLALEETERSRKSLERRQHNARIGAFKSACDFDFTWINKPDRETIEEALGLEFLHSGDNLVLLGPNGVGKTMLLKNIAYQAVVAGHTVRFCTASDMLSDLAEQESSSALLRRTKRYVSPKLLCVDEVGYLSYDNRYADLFFEVVSRRYQSRLPIALTTNKPFCEWPQVFPNAACVVTLVDRLMHHCNLIEIDAQSYRLKEATERASARVKQRASRRPKPSK